MEAQLRDLNELLSNNLDDAEFFPEDIDEIFSPFVYLERSVNSRGQYNKGQFMMVSCRQ